MYNPEHSRLYVEGEHIKKNGQIVQLVGALYGPFWNEEIGTPGNVQAREEMFINMRNAGANHIVLTLNFAFWKDPAYDNEMYKQNVMTWVDWAVKHDLFFTVGLHNSMYEGTFLYGGPRTYPIAETEPLRTWAIEMYVEWAETWKDLPNFVGIQILNEPAPWSVGYDKWDVVTQFYLDAIDAVKEVDPYCIFFVMAPYRTTALPKEWVKMGFLPRENIVLEFHQYYTYELRDGWPEYAVVYRDYGHEAGRVAYEEWLLDNIVSVRDDYNIPIMCGEFGVHLEKKAPVPTLTDIYALEQQADMMQLFNKYGIHYAQWRMYSYGGHPFAMATGDGKHFNMVGENWAENLPSEVVRP